MSVVQTSKAATFDSMLNEYLPYDLLMTEFKEMNWLLQNCNMKEGWLGSSLIIPYQQSYASSVKMGGLTDENDLDEATYVRGQLDGYKEAWASLVFNSRDLMEHDKVSEKNFLRILPDQIDQTLMFMKQLVSTAVLNTQEISTVVSVTSAGGVATLGAIVVEHPERFEIGQKIAIAVTASTQELAYVISINRNDGTLELATARGGTALDPATTAAAGDFIYMPDTKNGADDNGFSSLLYQVLPSGYLGAPATVFGQVKTASPFTQGLLYDAADWANGDIATGTAGAGNLITASSDVLAEIFNGLAKARQRGSDPDAFLMSYKHFSAVLSALEYGAGGRTLGSGAFKNVSEKVDYAGFSEITVGSVMGSVKLVAIREMTDKIILGIQTKKLDFHTNRGFKIQESPDGLKFYSTRQTTGYKYIVDYSFYGDFVYSCPYTAISITMPATYTGIPDFLI
jgi:hypothetical protein